MRYSFIPLALTMSAAAQTTATVRAIPTPFVGAMFALSPDGAMMAVYENAILVENEIADNLQILLIDPKTGEEIGRLEGTQVDLTRSVAFSPDGTHLTSYHANGDLIIWDLATQEATKVYDWLPTSGVYMDYLSDGQTLSLLAHNGVLGHHILFDLTSGSIIDMLGLRPDTFAEFSDIALVPLEMGIFSVAAQAVGPNGEIYGATGNGDVYRWNPETRERETLYPATDERPLRYPVRHLQVLDDGTLAFLDSGTNTFVHFAPDGASTQYTLNGAKFAESRDGLVVAFDSLENAFYTLDLNSDSAEPQRLEADLGLDAEGKPIEVRGNPVLAFTPDGEIAIGGVYVPEGESAVYILNFS